MISATLTAVIVTNLFIFGAVLDDLKRDARPVDPSWTATVTVDPARLNFIVD